MNCLQRIFLRVPRTLTPKNNLLKVCSRYYAKIAETNTEVETTFVPPPFLKLPPRTYERKKQRFDYFLVLDFEATCDSPVTVVPQEIIEFPVIKVNGETFETESIFHTYVRPVVNPQLTSFCTELTGITQEMIDDKPVFEDVFEQFHRWLEEENLLNGAKFIFATVGDWDLKYMFPMQCKFFRIPVADYMKSWINLKLSFLEMTTLYPRNLVTMMKYCQLQHEGKLHSGLDDCKNIAKLLKDLADRGMVYSRSGQTN